MAKWSPRKHPRDAKGRFRRKSGLPSVRSSTRGITAAALGRKISVRTARSLIKAKKRRGDIR